MHGVRGWFRYESLDGGGLDRQLAGCPADLALLDKRARQLFFGEFITNLHRDSPILQASEDGPRFPLQREVG